MRYDVVGEGRTIVFVHGWKLDARTESHDYEPVFARRPGWRRVYLTLPGMGGEPLPPDVTRQDDLLRLVLDAVEDMMPPEGLVLAGTSNGANLARAVAHRRPDQVHGLLMRVPMLVAADSARTRSDPALPRAAKAATAAKNRALWEPAQASADPGLALIRDDPARYALSDPAPGDVPFAKPALIVCGRQDSWVGWADAVPVLPLYPRATFAVLDRGPHQLPVVAAPLFEALVSEWLDRVTDEWPS